MGPINYGCPPALLRAVTPTVSNRELQADLGLQISVSSSEDSDQWAAIEPYSLIQDIVPPSSSNFDCQAETVDSMPFR